MADSTRDRDRDTESPTHQRPSFSDPLAGGIDPTAPGAPHEPGGTDYHQSQERSAVDPGAAIPDADMRPRRTDEDEPTRA
jgi:hypothetical protein